MTGATPVKLSLESLKLIKRKGLQFRLVNCVSSRWQLFGNRLQIPYNQLEDWKMKFHGNISRCWMSVMEHWLAVGGVPDYPTTWQGLYMLLEDVECAEVANQLKKFTEIDCA